MQTFENVWNNVKNVFLQFHWSFVLELILLFCCRILWQRR